MAFKEANDTFFNEKHDYKSILCVMVNMYMGQLLQPLVYKGQGCGLYIPWIRPNHCAASVAQWLEHLSY